MENRPQFKAFQILINKLKEVSFSIKWERFPIIMLYGNRSRITGC